MNHNPRFVMVVGLVLAVTLFVIIASAAVLLPEVVK